MNWKGFGRKASNPNKALSPSFHRRAEVNQKVSHRR
jgi:hypothetical protein